MTRVLESGPLLNLGREESTINGVAGRGEIEAVRWLLASSSSRFHVRASDFLSPFFFFLSLIHFPIHA